MRPRRLIIAVALVMCVAAAMYVGRRFSLADIPLLLSGTPHDRYALSLKFHGIAGTAAGRRWLESAGDALNRPERATLPLAVRRPLDVDAFSYAFALRRGQLYTADVEAGTRVFVDLFRQTDAGPRHVGSAPADGRALSIEAPSDGDYLVRVQPGVEGIAEARVWQTVQPSLGMPVQGARRASIQSGFGAPRDAGVRVHQGVDIFAPRGTHVVAAADGIVTSVGTNGLGGKVVWQVRPLRGESLYYAHLDTQLVKTGSYVRRGDVLGTVGNTGNARGGPTHLHFGIYARGGAVDPLPYLAAVAPPGGRAPSVRSHGETSLRKSPARPGPGASSAPAD